MAKTNFGRLNSQIQANSEKRSKGNNFVKFEKVEWGKIPFGDTIIQVCPPKVEDTDFFLEVYVHHNFEFAQKDGAIKKRSFLCSRKKHGQCPICDQVTKLNDQKLTKEAARIRGQKTFLYNALDYNQQLRCFPLKPTQHNEVIQEINAFYSDEGVDVTDLTNGKQIKISRLKAAPWARARILSKQADLSAERITEILSKLHDLDKVYIDNTPEELQKVLEGIDVNASKPKAAEGAEQEETAAETPLVEEVKPTVAPAVVAAATRGRPPKVTEPVAEKKAEPKVETKKAVESTGDPELDDIMGMLE